MQVQMYVEWYNMLGRSTKDVMLVLKLKSSKQYVVVQVFTMQIDVLGSNIVKHRLIIGH